MHRAKKSTLVDNILSYNQLTYQCQCNPGCSHSKNGSKPYKKNISSLNMSKWLSINNNFSTKLNVYIAFMHCNTVLLEAIENFILVNKRYVLHLCTTILYSQRLLKLINFAPEVSQYCTLIPLNLGQVLKVVMLLSTLRDPTQVRQ